MVNDHEAQISTKIVYTSLIVAFFKTLPRYCFIASRNEWTFPATELSKIKAFIDHNCGIYLVIDYISEIDSSNSVPNIGNINFTNEPFRIKIRVRYDVHAVKLFQNLPGSHFDPEVNEWRFPYSELDYIEHLCENMSTVVLVIESHEKALIKHVNPWRLRVSWPYNFNMWELYSGRCDVIHVNERAMECARGERDYIVQYFQENNVEWYEFDADDDISDDEALLLD
jgi:hypothetical protein